MRQNSDVYCRSTLGEAECMEIQRKSIGKGGVMNYAPKFRRLLQIHLGEAECMEIQRKSKGKGGVREFLQVQKQPKRPL